MTGNCADDVWQSTLSMLAIVSSREFTETRDVFALLPKPPLRRTASSAEAAARVSAALTPQHAGTVRVDVVERLGDGTISVSWHDSTACNYEEQVWIVRRALRAGRCVLSGRAINRGDRVFRPRCHAGRIPSNFDGMILSDAVANSTAA